MWFRWYWWFRRFFRFIFRFYKRTTYHGMPVYTRLLDTLVYYLPCFPMMAKWLPNPLPSSIQTELNGGKNGQFLRLAFTLLFYIYTNSVEVIGAENHQKTSHLIFFLVRSNISYIFFPKNITKTTQIAKWDSMRYFQTLCVCFPPFVMMLCAPHSQ